mgnify:CR=1 FL=1
MKTKRIIIFLMAAVATSAVCASCASMQLYEEAVDHDSPPENISYPMPEKKGQTGEFSYEIVDGVWIDVHYPAQYGYWTPNETPELHRDADLVTIISCSFGGKKSIKITDFRAELTMLDKKGGKIEPKDTLKNEEYPQEKQNDKKGGKIEPKDTQGTETGRNWSFGAGSLPEKSLSLTP